MLRVSERQKSTRAGGKTILASRLCKNRRKQLDNYIQLYIKVVYVVDSPADLFGNFKVPQKIASQKFYFGVDILVLHYTSV